MINENDVINRELKMGEADNDVKHIYVQASKNGEIGDIYFVFNDGYVERLEMVDPNLSNDIKKQKLMGLFKEMGVSKNKGQDYTMALTSDKIFKELDRKVEEQRREESGEYDFEVKSSKLPKVLNLRFNKDLFKKNKKEEAKEEAIGEVPEFEFDDDDDAKLSPKHAAIAGGIVALAIAIGACGIIKMTDVNDSVNDAIGVEASDGKEDTNSNTTTVVKPSMEGQSYEYYVSYAPEGLQKSTMVSYHDYVMNFNNSEGWMYSELTPEMKEELEKMSITLDGDEALFGFTAEEVNAFNLVYGTHTNEEYTKLMNGKYIDVTKVMSSAESEMNQAIRKAIVYYLNSDNAHLGIENAINFTDSEKEQINKFEDMFQEYKDLLNSEKYDEAETKMKEIKQAVLEYAHAQDTEVNNAKPYILRTLVPAFSVYSVSYGYQDTITLNLQDNATGKPVDKEVKTTLWDEITMRDLVEGYKECKDEHGVVYQDGFSEIEFLNRLSIDSKKYSLIISDDGVSIADTYVGGLENKLSGANDYMEKLRTENNATDAYVAATVDGADVSNNSELDTLTSASYDQETILEMIDNALVNEHRYPVNLNFFTSMYSKFTKQVIAFKDALYSKIYGKTITENNGKKEGTVVKTIPGKTIYIPGTTTTYTWTETWTETYTSTRTEKRRVSEDEIAEEDAVNRKKAQEEASKTTVTDGKTGKEKETTYQDIYNKKVNDKTDGKTDLDTNVDDDDKTHDSDPLVQKVDKWAEEDAEQINKEHEKASEGAKESYVDESGNTHYISGGDEHIEEEYENADTVSEEEAEKYNQQLQQSQQSQNNTSSTTPVTGDNGNSNGNNEYTTEDPTTSPTFAPVVEEVPVADVSASLSVAPSTDTNAFDGFTTEDPTTSPSFAPAYEEEVDAIIESMANEVNEVSEASEGMSR